MTGGVGHADLCGRSFQTDGRLRPCGGRPQERQGASVSGQEAEQNSQREDRHRGWFTHRLVGTGREMKPLGVSRRALLGSGGWRLAQGHSIVRAALGLEPVPYPLRRPRAYPEPPTPAPILSVPTQKTLERQHLVCKEWGFQSP